MLKIHVGYERDTSSVKFMTISRQNSPEFLPGVSAGYCPEFWWLNMKWLEFRWGMHGRSVMVAVLETPCAIPPRNSNRWLNFI
jgi:hypothetical protein